MEPTVYSLLLTDVNDAMVTARRIDRVAEHQPGDALYTNVSDPFVAAVSQCRVVAEHVAFSLESGERMDRKALLESADSLESTPPVSRRPLRTSATLTSHSQHRPKNCSVSWNCAVARSLVRGRPGTCA